MPWETVEPTTSPAARAASSAACSRTTRPLEALTATCLVAEVLGLVEVAAVVVVAALDGNPVTGYALGKVFHKVDSYISGFINPFFFF